MLTNADITLYHACADPEQKRKIYRRTVIHGVHWFTNQRTTVNDGLKSADEYRIRIPQEACAAYIEKLIVEKVLNNGREYLQNISEGESSDTREV